MINTVILLGRLTADPELRTSNGGIPYTRFTVAVDRPSRQGEEKKADFISCLAWRQTAEFITKWFAKGNTIAVEGAIQTGSYTNRDGAKVYTTDVLVSKASFTGSRSDSGSQQTARQETRQETRTDARQNSRPAAARGDDRRPPAQSYSRGTPDDYMYPPCDDDLPF
jgi:single-strand DNA-binding protein